MCFLRSCCIMVGIVLVTALSSFAVNEDLRWAARWLLPNGQYETDEVEWTSSNGYIYGNGNVVVVKLRFDQLSIDTFNYIPQGGNYHAFGLEIDVVECSDSQQMEASSIDHTFSLETKPVMDTTFGDNVTNSGTCASNGKHPYVVGSLLIRDPHELEKDKDYYVYFNLKNPIPSEGVNLHLTLQLSYDVQYVTPPLLEVLTDYFGNAGVLDSFDYFVVEGDSYVSFTAKPSGWSGVCWSNKTGSSQCDVAENIGICPYTSSFNSKMEKWFTNFPFLVTNAFAGDCVSASRAEGSSIVIGDLGIPLGYGDTDPDPTTPDTDPNIHINSLDIRLIGGSYTKEIQKTLYWGQFFQFEGRAEFENRSSAEAKDIDADYRITDSRSNFNEDATKIDEDGLFNINPGEREENTINPITVRVSEDGTKVYYSQGSMTKSFDIINGFSKVYIFADIEVNGDKDISSPSDHDEYGKIELVVLRPPCQPSFTQTPTSGIRPLTVSFTNTSISNASDCTYAWSFGDGGTTNVYHPSYVYNTAGTYIPKLTASSYSYSYSTTKSGNTISITNPIPPSMMITNPTGSDNWRSDNTKHITWNMYNFPTLGNVRIDYTLDSGNVWRNIDTVTPNDGSRYWNMCNSYTIDSPNSYIRICSIEYGVCATSARFYIDHARGCK